MYASDRLHEPIIVAPRDTELFKRFLPKKMMPDSRVVGAEFDKLWSQDGILFKIREREHSALSLFGSRSSSLLETAFKMKFAEWSVAMKEPVTVHTPRYVTAATRETNGIRRCLFVGRDFPCMMQNENALLGETGFHGVKHLFHAGTVVLVFLMQFAQDVEYDKVGYFRLYQTFDEVLSALRCHQEGEHHIVLMDQPKVWDIEVITQIFELAEALSPGGFFGVKLEIENFLWRWASVTHHGFAFGYPGGNIECKEAFAHLGRAKQEHITRLWD